MTSGRATRQRPRPWPTPCGDADVTDVTKPCRVCLRDLSLDSFNVDRNRKDGLRANCKTCAAAIQRAYYAQTLEARTRYEYSPARRSEKNARARARYAIDPRPARSAGKAWRDTNRDQARMASRRWYAENTDRAKAQIARWKVANRDAVLRNSLAGWHRRRARLLELTCIPFTRDQLDQRMSMFGHRCWMCGGPFEHVDHVKPLSKGGAHMLCNLRPACRSCNLSKASRWPLAS